MAVVYDNSSVSNTPRIYIDGVQQTLATNSSPPGGTARSDADLNFTIGNHAAAATRTFSGRIDEVRISRSLRSNAEIVT